MRRRLAGLALIPLSLVAGESVTVDVRGKAQTLERLRRAGDAAAAVIFLPGDGGWRGAAVKMARTISSWGYDVYGFDTRAYLEGFSKDGAKLSQEQLAADVRRLAAGVREVARRPVILAGWSQGAGMAVAAVAGRHERGLICGVLTLGLPEAAVLGWDWKATLAALAKRTPDQPAFPVKPLLAEVAPTPIWMIHGSEDEYTSMAAGRALFAAAGEPKRRAEIAGANHRFDGHEDELYRSLKEGLQWVGPK